MIAKLCSFLLAVLVVAAHSSGVSAAPFYTEDFDVDPTANWTVNKSHADNAGSDANFFFDYSTVGIPPAPHSNGTTRGLRMRANMGALTPSGSQAAVFSGLSVSPTGFSLPSGNYRIKFDWWGDFQGSTANGVLDGGSGTTQAGSWGINTSGTSAQWAGGVHDSLWFAATVDGGSAQDYRVYPNAALATGPSNYYAAGNTTSPDPRNDTDNYYQGVGSQSPPAAQAALFPATQHGQTRPGAAGMTWRDMEIRKNGEIVQWFMDDLLIATVDLNTVGGSFGGSNFFLGHFDTNGTASADATAPTLLFSLIDNVRVVPEPASVLLGAWGLIGLLGVRRRM